MRVREGQRTAPPRVHGHLGCGCFQQGPCHGVVRSVCVWYPNSAYLVKGASAARFCLLQTALAPLRGSVCS